MIEWSEQHRMIRDAVRRFVEAEVVPRAFELEHGDLPPYDILRKLVSTFGMDELARARFRRQIERERAEGARSEPQASEEHRPGDSVALQLIPIIELCRHCPGLVTAMGVSMGLTAAAILAKGTTRQKERWALPLLTLEKIGAWAITEPGSGSDAFGGMKSTARRDGHGGYVLNGSKTFITNGPHADVIVFLCKLDEPGVASAERLYAARAAIEVALEAVQVHGGNGYMAEYQVEQLCRDAKVLQIYAGTDEIQISAIARDLLSR